MNRRPRHLNPATFGAVMALDARAAARTYADAATVTTWTGNPGTSLNAIGVDQTMDVDGLNGLPAVSFPATLNLPMSHTADVTASCTWIVAFQITSALSGYKSIAAAGANGSAGSMILANTTSNKWGSYGGSNLNAGTALASGSVSILSMVDSAGSGGSFFRNGAADGTWAANSEGQATKHIGGFNGQEVPMKLGAIVLFYSAVSDPVRRRIEQSLALTWRIACA